MRITDMTGYAFYASNDRSRVEAVMDGDNTGHWRARNDGLKQIEEVDYWLIKLKEEQERKERERIEYHIRVARSDGWSVV